MTAIQGRPAKVKPTFIFAGKIDKIQWYFGKCDNNLVRHTPREA